MLLHQKQIHDNDSCVVDVCHVLSITLNTLSGHKMVFNPSKFICYAENDSVVFLVSASVNVGLAICLIFYCYVRIIKTVRTHNHNFQNTGNLTNFLQLFVVWPLISPDFRHLAVKMLWTSEA